MPLRAQPALRGEAVHELHTEPHRLLAGVVDLVQRGLVPVRLASGEPSLDGLEEVLAPFQSQIETLG